MNDIMVDIETLGIVPGSVIMSIAAVQFDINTGTTGKSFQINIDVDDSLSYGFTVDEETQKWWKDQNPALLQSITELPNLCAFAISFFSKWLIEVDCINARIWSKSPQFDIVFLESYFRKLDIAIPWKYRQHMDVRTVYNLFPEAEFIRADNNLHHPLYDCIYQIKRVSNIFQSRVLQNPS